MWSKEEEKRPHGMVPVLDGKDYGSYYHTNTHSYSDIVEQGGGFVLFPSQISQRLKLSIPILYVSFLNFSSKA